MHIKLRRKCFIVSWFSWVHQQPNSSLHSTCTFNKAVFRAACIFRGCGLGALGQVGKLRKVFCRYFSPSLFFRVRKAELGRLVFFLFVVFTRSMPLVPSTIPLSSFVSHPASVWYSILCVTGIVQLLWNVLLFFFTVVKFSEIFPYFFVIVVKRSRSCARY